MATKEHLSTEDLVAPKEEDERPATAEGHATEETGTTEAPLDADADPVVDAHHHDEHRDEHEHGSSIPEQPQVDEPSAEQSRTDHAHAGPTRAEDTQSGRHSTPGTQKSTVDQQVELFSRNEVEEFRGRWQNLQTAFVDDPRETVHSADELVAEVMQALATTFANHKRDLENQWRQGEEVATEDLRVALQRYRTFFNELLRD